MTTPRACIATINVLFVYIARTSTSFFQSIHPTPPYPSTYSRTNRQQNVPGTPRSLQTAAPQPKKQTPAGTSLLESQPLTQPQTNRKQPPERRRPTSGHIPISSLRYQFPAWATAGGGMYSTLYGVYLMMRAFRNLRYIK